MRQDTIVEQATAKEITHEDVEMVRRFGAEFRRADEAVLECRVAATPAAEVTWCVDNVEISQTNEYQIVFTADGWCRLIIRDDMLEDEAEYTVRAVNEAGTCISTAYLTVLRKLRSLFLRNNG